MKRANIYIYLIAAAIGLALFGVTYFTADAPVLAQTAAQDEPKMPEVIVLGKDAKLGQVTFNHVKHNGGAYNIDKSSPIACVSCHHVASAKRDRQASAIEDGVAEGPDNDADRELFAKIRKASVVGCHSCHARGTETRVARCDTADQTREQPGDDHDDQYAGLSPRARVVMWKSRRAFHHRRAP